MTFRDVDGSEPPQVEHTEEELLSLNEELQSSNEELGTSKEKLEALTEEMSTINRELEDKNADLRAANADLYNLFQSTGIPTIFLDSDLAIRRFTPAATEVMRLVPSDVGRSISHVKERFHDGRTVDECREVLASQKPSSREIWTDSGRCYLRRLTPYRNEEQEIEGVCITFTDVTEQKQAVIVSEAARRYAEAVIRHVRTPLLVLDERQRVTTVNPAFRQVFGDDRKYEGEALADLENSPWDVVELRRPLEQVIRGRTDVTDLELRIDEQIFLVNISAIAQDKDYDLVLLSFEDVTRDRRAREAAAERQKELARDASRKDQWIAMLGHELRNPIGAITNGIALLKSDLPPARRETVHAMLHRQTRQISRLLDDLLDAGRVIAGKLQIAREPVDIGQVARWALETLNPQFEQRQHELTVDSPGTGIVWVEGDANRLTEVMANLLSNAAKYTEPGGRIALRVGADEAEVKVTVQDNGAGIDPDFMPHIFDVFSQGPRGLDRSSKGLGLGLPLVRNIVELHGGRVEAYSEGPGRGSRFEVTLPRMRYTPSPKPEREIEAPSRRILIVDDEADSMATQADLLESKGHRVRIIDNGEDAMDVAAQFHPEVVLLDLGMPGMNGYELAKNLRERGCKATLVAVSGYRQDLVRQQEAGIDHHLTKPVDQKRLQALLAGETAARSRPERQAPR